MEVEGGFERCVEERKLVMRIMIVKVIPIGLEGTGSIMVLAITHGGKSKKGLVVDLVKQWRMIQERI